MARKRSTTTKVGRDAKQVDSYRSKKRSGAKARQLFRPLGENLGKEMFIFHTTKHLFPINLVVWKQIMLIAFVGNIMRSCSIALWKNLLKSLSPICSN